MNYAYNLMDENLRRFNAAVPMYAQWDDHEVTNNWYWELRKDQDKRYKEGSVALLAARALRAFHDYMPTRLHPLEQDRLYTSFAYGPSLEVFRIDLRSYRGPNSEGMQTELSPEARIIGAQQLPWLMQALKDSRATWKVIACDMPIGLIVWDNFVKKQGVEAVAQGDMGAAKGRELEFAELFRFIRDQNIKNVVWLTADVHYTAAHRYDPNRAQFQEFAPFWEFVSGPLNAGTFGPNELDATFGPELVYVKAPAARPGQPAALGRDAVLRPGRHRRRQRGDDRAAEGHGRGDTVHAGAGAGRYERATDRAPLDHQVLSCRRMSSNVLAGGSVALPGSPRIATEVSLLSALLAPWGPAAHTPAPTADPRWWPSSIAGSLEASARRRARASSSTCLALSCSSAVMGGDRAEA